MILTAILSGPVYHEIKFHPQPTLAKVASLVSAVMASVVMAYSCMYRIAGLLPSCEGFSSLSSHSTTVSG